MSTLRHQGHKHQKIKNNLVQDLWGKIITKRADKTQHKRAKVTPLS